jgi:hypothetical protein
LIIKMNQNTFQSLKDTELSRACFDPIIPMIRAKGMDVKEEVYAQLTEGQKALFMFNAYYNHASKSLVEFYWWSAYYFAQPRTWAALSESLQYFQTYSMNQLVTEIGNHLEASDYPKTLEGFKIAYNDLDHNQELHDTFTALFTTFNHITPETLQIIGSTIRTNPVEYIKFEEENIC